MKKAGSLSAAALSLSLAFAPPALANPKYAEVTAKKAPHLPEQTISIPCGRLGDTSRPSLETVTEIDSAIHGFDGNPYLDKAYRKDLENQIIANNPRFSPATLQARFNAPYVYFDRQTPGNQLNQVVQKLNAHGVSVPEINEVLDACRS